MAPPDDDQPAGAAAPTAALDALLHLEPHGADTYVGTGPRYPWGGLYGGQIVGQALRAAALTTADGLRPHSLRAYFIRAGDHTEPIRFEVDRLRNGRSFTTRRVVARQATGAILNLEASFTGDAPGRDLQPVPVPAAPGPDDPGLATDSWSPLFQRRYVPLAVGVPTVSMWLRWASPLGDDPLVHDAAFAYLSDDAPSEAIAGALLEPGRTVEEQREGLYGVSLDHTIWFHRPVRADAWQLHHLTCQRFVGGRGLAVGHVFDEAGTHLATVAQEMLFRRLER